MDMVPWEVLPPPHRELKRKCFEWSAEILLKASESRKGRPIDRKKHLVIHTERQRAVAGGSEERHRPFALLHFQDKQITVMLSRRWKSISCHPDSLNNHPEHASQRPTCRSLPEEAGELRTSHAPGTGLTQREAGWPQQRRARARSLASSLSSAVVCG